LTLVFTKLAREEHRPPRVYRPLDAAGLGPRFWRLLAVFFLFSLGNSTDSFLILRARNLNMSLSSIFVLLAGFNLVNVLFSFYSGALSDRFGRKRFLTAGWVLYALVYAGFGHARSAGQVIPLLLLYGAYYGLTEGVGKALVADIVSVERRATAYGVLGAAQGFSVLPAGVLAGWLWGAVSPAAPFWAGSALSLLAAAALAVGV
ncbi:MAG TPA: MFS transporter, partial [Elusimicrobiota bacterium]|nr:MFS transporter [Elusimicrobiota bacterium]